MWERGSPSLPPAPSTRHCWRWPALSVWAWRRRQQPFFRRTKCSRRWPKAPSASRPDPATRACMNCWRRLTIWRPNSRSMPSALVLPCSTDPATRRSPHWPSPAPPASCAFARCLPFPMAVRFAATSARVSLAASPKPRRWGALPAKRCAARQAPLSPRSGAEPMAVTALITRPQEDARPLADELAARGIAVVIEPLLAIVTLPAAASDLAGDLAGVQALLFTSANGVRAFAELSSRRDIGALAVGDATAAAARGVGFIAVESAGGDVKDLARLAKLRLKPEGGPLFHAAGSAVAGDLAQHLPSDGFTLRRPLLYGSQAAQHPTPAP